MDSSHTQINRVLVVILVVLLVFAAGAFYVYRPSSPLSTGPGGAGNTGVISGLDDSAVSAIVKDTLPSGVITALTGTVVRKTGNILTLDVPRVLGVNIPRDAEFRVRTVLVSNETRITERVPRDAAELQREIELYSGGRLPGRDLPPPYDLAPINFDAFSEGDVVMVHSGGEDVKSAKTIQATHITLWESGGIQ